MKFSLVFNFLTKTRKMETGEDVFQNKLEKYVLTNESGISVTLMNYGAIIHSILVPDRNGEIDDVLLGFKDLNDYKTNPPYFGAVIGRVANRIAEGKFSIDGQKFELFCNERNINHLHGGVKGFDKHFWDAVLDEEGKSISFYLNSPDGDEGYPGELNAIVHYVLNNDNELKMTFKTTVKEKPTIVNLTCHPYFNLSGTQKKCDQIDDHLLEINANTYLPVDCNSIPTGEKRSVLEDDNAFNFRQPKVLDDALKAVPGRKFDHTFCKSHKDAFAARLYHPGSGRVLEVFSSQPGTHIYTPDYQCGTLRGKHGEIYQGRCGLAIENQNFPNAINMDRPLCPILRPGDLYEQFITFKFSTK